MRRLPHLLLLGLLAACSSKKDRGPDPLATVQGFCEEWAAAACTDKVLENCVTDAKSCQAAQQSFCESLVPDGKYSSTTATDCLKAVEDAYADGQLTAQEHDTVLQLGAPCDKIVSGSGGDGDPCTADGDCNRDADLSCVKKALSPDGTCHKPVVVMGGYDCSPAAAVCTEGFYCDGANCVAGKALDGTCSESAPCQKNLRCLDADGKPLGTATDGGTADGGVPTGTCKPKLKGTLACMTDADCESNLCLPKANSDTGVCSDKIPLSPSEPVCGNL